MAVLPYLKNHKWQNSTWCKVEAAAQLFCWDAVRENFAKLWHADRILVSGQTILGGWQLYWKKTPSLVFSFKLCKFFPSSFFIENLGLTDFDKWMKETFLGMFHGMVCFIILGGFRNIVIVHRAHKMSEKGFKRSEI